MIGGRSQLAFVLLSLYGGCGKVPEAELSSTTEEQANKVATSIARPASQLDGYSVSMHNGLIGSLKWDQDNGSCAYRLDWATEHVTKGLGWRVEPDYPVSLMYLDESGQKLGSEMFILDISEEFCRKQESTFERDLPVNIPKNTSLIVSRLGRFANCVVLDKR